MGAWQRDLAESLWLSIRLASLTTLILVVLGLPLAGWLARSRRSWVVVAEVVVTLPIVLPPTVIGFYLLLLSSPGSWLGGAWLRVFGTTLPFSFEGLVLGSMVYSLPFAVQPMVAAIRSVDPVLVEAAVALGATARHVFLRIIVPAAKHGILGGAILCFAHTVGEFGVVLMLGGSIPGHTRVASILLYDRVQSLDYGHAQMVAAAMLAIAFILLGWIGWLRRRNTSVMRRPAAHGTSAPAQSD